MRDVLQSARPRRAYGVDRSDGATVVYPSTGDPVANTRAARVWPRALHPFRSPCRIDAGKGLAQHRCSASHAGTVEAYRAWRDGEYAAADADPQDRDSYWQQHARPTFRAFLRQTSEAAREESRKVRVAATFAASYARRDVEESARAEGLRRAARVRTGPPCLIDDGPEPCDAGTSADGCHACARCTACECPTCITEAPTARPGDWE